MKTRAILSVLAVLLLALFISCGDDTCTGPRPTYYRTSPEEVVAALGYAIEQGDMGIYRECLGPDYWFSFRPEDAEIAGVPEKRPIWERSQDMAAMDSLLGDPAAEVIEAEFIIREMYPPGGGVDTLLRCDPNIRILIANYLGEETTFVVCGGWLYIYLNRDEADETLWHIAGIQEATIPATSAPSSVLPCSFGELKAMFRYRDECEINRRWSPECLFRNFELSLETMNIGFYDECLHDEYLFSFTPGDAESIGLPPDAPWWGKAVDVSVMQRVFNDPVVVRTECSLGIAAGPWPGEEGLMYRLEPDMRFTIQRCSMPEDTVLMVNSSWLDVEIVEDPYDYKQWVFKSIEETLKEPFTAPLATGAGTKATPATTFGSIKARYKPDGL